MRSMRKINELGLNTFSIEDLQIVAWNEFSSPRLRRWVRNPLVRSYLFFSSLHLPNTNKLTTDIDSV